MNHCIGIQFQLDEWVSSAPRKRVPSQGLPTSWSVDHHAPFHRGNVSPSTPSYLLCRDALKAMTISGRLLPLAHIPDPFRDVGEPYDQGRRHPRTDAHQILGKLKLF